MRIINTQYAKSGNMERVLSELHGSNTLLWFKNLWNRDLFW